MKYISTYTKEDVANWLQQVESESKFESRLKAVGSLLMKIDRSWKKLFTSALKLFTSALKKKNNKKENEKDNQYKLKRPLA